MDANEKRNYLPSCWADDVRMNAMYTVFRSKDVNPTGWQEKMNFWVNSISQYCQKCSKVSVTVGEICTAFLRDKKEPKCINEVLNYMSKEGLMIPLSEFSKNEDTSSWLGWGYTVLKKPVVSSFSLVKNMLFVPSAGETVEERYVIPEVLKNVTDQVFSRHKHLEKLGDVESIIELNDFKNRMSDICSGVDMEIVLSQLKREKKAVIIDENGDQYIKFKSDDVNYVQPITEVDKAILRLRKASDTVCTEIEVVEKEIDKCVAEAKTFLKAGNKAKAMLSLKRKKRLEIALKKKTVSADNLENLLLQLKNTGSENLVIQAYSTGVDAMKNRVKTGLDIDKVDAIMSDLEATIGDVSEICAVMSKSFSEEDLSDVEAELDELLAEDRVPAKRPLLEDERSVEDMDAELMRRLESLRVPDSPPAKEKVATKAF